MCGIGANSLTLFGIVSGLAAGIAVGLEEYLCGLALLLINRVMDGLDGAVARASGITDFGGYLDIVGDFVFYVCIPVGFGIASPENLLPALFLVASFALTGVSFLAYAALASKRGLTTELHGKKSFLYNTGLAEGAETIAAFALMCVFPEGFGIIAVIFTGLCLLTVIQRSLKARRTFPSDRP